MARSMLNVLGDSPLEWKPKWEKMRSEAVARGDFRAGEWKRTPRYRLKTRFDQHVHEPELKGLLPVIQGLTKFLPSDRIPASKALQMMKDNCGSAHNTE